MQESTYTESTSRDKSADIVAKEIRGLAPHIHSPVVRDSTMLQRTNDQVAGKKTTQFSVSSNVISYTIFQHTFLRFMMFFYEIAQPCPSWIVCLWFDNGTSSNETYAPNG